MSERESTLIDEWLESENNRRLLWLTDDLKEDVIKRFQNIVKQFKEQVKVYLSYSARCRPHTVFEMADKLSFYDFKVLIDKNVHRETDIEENFQKAIDDADVFLLFFSEAYKTSDLCQNEILYAERRNKRLLAINIDKAEWDEWLNFYLGEHLWVNYDEDEPVDKTVKTMAQQLAQVVLQPPPQNSRFECLMPIDVPSIPRYFQRKLVEDKILDQLRNTCKRPDEGVMVVDGDDGRGKTTTIAHILLDKANTDFFIVDCGIHIAIWVNCYEWRDVATFTEKQQRAFIDKIIHTGRETAAADPAFATIQFFEIDDVVEHFRQLQKSIIFILDHVSHLKIVEAFRKHCQAAPCCVITRHLPKSYLLKKPIHIPLMSDDELMCMFETTCDLEGKLTQKQLYALAKRSDGSPMIGSLITARFGDCEKFMYDQECELLLAEPFSPKPHQKIRQLFDFNMSRAELKEKNSRQLFFAFLMFEPGEPVCVDDIAILWGYEGEFYQKGVLRTKGLCRVLERKCLLIRLQDYGATKEDYFCVHQLIFEAAVQNAKSFFNVQMIEEIRRKIASGACSAASDEEQSATLVGIVGETILQKRRFLLERIIDKCDAAGLAELSQQKSKKTGGMTFLHFLYNTEWPDNVMLKWNISLGTNHSYCLIAKIMETLYHKQLSFEKAVTDTDPTLDCLLIDIYNQENSSLFSADRQKILKYLRKWNGEYYDCKDEKEAVEKFGFHPAITSTVKGDFEMVRHYFSLSSFIDPTTECEIDKDEITQSAIEAAARHGHLSIFQYLFEEHFDATIASSSQLLKAYMLAAANGHVEILQLLYGENKCDAYSQDQHGLTACHYAARGGHLNVIEFLFVYAQTPKILAVQDREGFTPLMYAARFGHEHTVYALHRMNPDVIKMTTNNNWTALSWASVNGFRNAALFLHEHYPEAIKLPSLQDKMIPIMAAASRGHVEVVKLLYSKYTASMRVKDGQGFTPLMHAAAQGHLETVTYLYNQYKAGVSIANSKGQTCLMVACQNGHSDVAEFFIGMKEVDLNARSNEGMTAFQYAAFNGHLGVVKLLAERDKSVLEVTITNNRKCSGLSFAVMKGHLDIVQYLYNKDETAKHNKQQSAKQRKAKIDDEEDDNYMMLISAILSSRLEVVAFLAEQHPNALRYKDSEGQSALMVAAGFGFLDIAEYLYIKYPEAVEMTDIEGMTALMRATAKGTMSVIEYLYKKYPKAATLPALDGSVCLTIAVRSGNVKVVDYFLQIASESLETVDNEGFTTLMVAVQMGFVEIVQRLLQKSADGPLITMKDNQGMTALAHAAKVGRLDMCKLLHAQTPVLVTVGDKDEYLPIAHAIVNGHLTVVQFLHEQYSNCSYHRARKLKVPLMIAVEYGHVEIVRFLYEKCDEAASYKDSSGDNVFQMAIKSDRIDVLECLVEKYRNTLVRTFVDGQSHSLLAQAALLGKTEMVRVLYDAFPEALTLESAEGLTPLSLAAAEGHLPVIDFFRSRDPSCVSRLDRNGNTAVTYAMRNNKIEAVKFLFGDLAGKTFKELLAMDIKNDTIVALCRFARRLTTAEDWELLLQPSVLASESTETTAVGQDAKKRSYKNINESNPNLKRTLEILRALTTGGEAFSVAFVERDGLKVFAKLLFAIRDFKQPENTPSETITSLSAFLTDLEVAILSTLANVVEYSPMRISVASNAELQGELMSKFEGDLNNGTDQRPWLAAVILGHLLLLDRQRLQNMNKTVVLKELWTKIEQWSEVLIIELGKASFRSCLPLVPMLNDDSSEPPAVRRFALWLLCILIEGNEKIYRPIIETEGIVEVVQNVATPALSVADELSSNLAQRFLNAIEHHNSTTSMSFTSSS